jgi:hypothetical protein
LGSKITIVTGGAWGIWRGSAFACVRRVEVLVLLLSLAV